MNLSITCNQYSIENNYGIHYASGTISIGDDFSETITMALNFWSVKDYERQWKEGLSRIKSHDSSCLVASIQSPILSNPLINWWTLYREDKKVFIYNELITKEDYLECVGTKLFSPDSCYNFIGPQHPEDNYEYESEEEREEDLKYQESVWVVELD